MVLTERVSRQSVSRSVIGKEPQIIETSAVADRSQLNLWYLKCKLSRTARLVLFLCRAGGDNRWSYAILVQVVYNIMLYQIIAILVFGLKAEGEDENTLAADSSESTENGSWKVSKLTMFSTSCTLCRRTVRTA